MAAIKFYTGIGQWLLCPAGAHVKAAVDNGADAVYIGLKNDTNARHFAGLTY